MRKVSTKKITSIGGSALIEGIMMRGPKRTTVCVRTGENEIYSEDIKMTTIPEKCKLFKLPILRGIAGLIDSMRLSYKSLMLSADKAVEAGEVEEEEPSKFEKWLDEKFGDKLVKVVMVFASILGVALAVGLFFFLPSFLFDLTANVIPVFQGDGEGAIFWKSVFEGVLKIALFLGYIVLCSQMTEMKRVFMYHGAEHKSIACYESGLDLTVENVKKMTRFHPRCGTSFIFVMLIFSVIFYSILAKCFPVIATQRVLWMLLKLVFLPILVGLGYEFSRYAGKHGNLFVKIVSAPGLWMQRLTTREPDDSMMEVGIAALKAVITDNPEDDEIK